MMLSTGPVPFVVLVGAVEARLCVLAEVKTVFVFEDLRFEPTKFLKRWFMDDMNTCAEKLASRQADH